MGICGDVLMATSAQINPEVNIPVLRDHTRATENLLGFTGVIGPRRDEIRQLLNSVGITINNFSEAIANTRYNAELMNIIDTAILQMKTFKVEKTDITKLTFEGSQTQLVITTPQGANNGVTTRWTQSIVQPRTVFPDSFLDQ